MGVFKGGVAPSAIYAWVPDEKLITQVFTWDDDGNEHLVFDNTLSAFVSVPIATASAAAVAPVVSVQPGAIVVPSAAATAQALPVGVKVDSVATVPTATATAAGLAPMIRVDANPVVPTATASAEAIPTLNDATIAVPTAEATAQAIPATVQTSGSQTVPVPTATATAQALPATASVSATVVVPIATASAVGLAPTIRVDAAPVVPTATATAAALVPSVVVVTFTPMRMNKSGSFQTTSSTAVQVTGWTADGSYPGTVITSDKLVAANTGTGKTVSAAVVYTDTLSGTHNMGIWRNGVQIGSTVSQSAQNGTLTLTPITGVTVTASDTFEMRIWHNTGFNMVVTNAGTFLKFE